MARNKKVIPQITLDGMKECRLTINGLRVILLNQLSQERR
jgi:hypothetical protein